MKRIFSGIQPSGVIHIGNYLGAIKQWVELQDVVDSAIYCVVDMHAITVLQEKNKLHQNVLKTAAIYLAAGIDTKKSSIFLQSTRPEHAELAWILNCFTKIGELDRMTQFKDKSGEHKVGASAGLYNYPILMAADILLYQTTDVPVGDDQKQHVEITRNIAERINQQYGKIFTVPEPIINKNTSRIMGLDNPAKKMSKSAKSEYNYISLLDKPDIIEKKVKRAVTDSENEITSDKNKIGINNLLNIFSAVSGKSVSEIELRYKDKGYGIFKKDLSEAIIEYLKPIQSRYDKIIKDHKYISDTLVSGSNKVAPIAKDTLQKVKKAIGLGLS